jgi:spore coat protein U-like protein
MRKTNVSYLLAVALLASVVGSASAQTSTGNLSVSSSVAQSCVVSATSTLAFGAYDPVGANFAAPLPGTGSVSIRCTKGSSGITIDLDAGANASGTQRRMVGGTSGDFLNYIITQPATTTPWTSCPATTPWGTLAAGSLYTPTGVTWGAGSAQAFTVCGSVPQAQNVSADASYTDTVTVTVNF